jgi:DNA-binding NtrC family response regulator
VASLSEAKEKLNEDIDLILSDIRLDESDPNNKDGIALLEWSKKNFPEIPVVLITVYRDFEIAVNALNLGAAKFMKKPINISELKETLKEVLKG